MKKNVFLLTLAAFMLVGCGNNNQNSNPEEGEEQGDDPTIVDDTKVTGVDISKTSLSLVETNSTQLTATVHPNTAINQNVTWESSNPMVVSVDDNGNLLALNEGTATITVKTEDGGYTSSCNVTVIPPEKTIVKDEYNLQTQGFTFDNKSLTNYPLTYKDYTITCAVGSNTSNNQPTLIKAKNKHYEARIYWGNTFTVTSTTNTLTKIEFTLGDNDKGNTMTPSVGEIKDGSWVGEAKEITFSISGTSGYKAFEAFTFCYEGEQEEDDPDTPMNLGTKTIKQVKDYIAKHPISGNSFGNWVNEKRYVTIEGVAVARIDTVKETKSYGLDLTYAAKVIMADETGFIGCASKTGQGNLWYKVGDYVAKETSKYSVCGYLSYIQGKPELKIISYEYQPDLEVNYDPAKLSKGDVDIDGFYDEAVATNYNVAGHGYGDVVTLKGVYCYQYEANGQGKRYYWFTDGDKQMRVNAFNMPSVSVGGNYDITGIISLKNYSPIIVAWDIKANTGADPFVFDYETAAVEITAANLNKLCPPQDDTLTRQPNSIRAFANFYKVVGYYLNVAAYNAISDVAHSDYSGLPGAIADNNVIVFADDNVYGTYEVSENSMPYYFMLKQFHSSDKKSIWEGIFLDAFLETLRVENKTL